MNERKYVSGPKPRSDAYCIKVLNAHVTSGGVAQRAARALNMPITTFKNTLEEAQRRNLEPTVELPAPAIEVPIFPDEDISTETIIDHLSSRFEKRRASYEAHTWFKVQVKDDRPIGILWFGDPHVDDNGANWPVLRRDCELCRTTDGLYGANIGDSTNNWSGRLAHLYAKQDTSVETAHRLASWFMLDSGVRWLIWLYGNHDKWGDGSAVLGQMAKRFGTQPIVCHDWEARFSLAFPSGSEFHIWAAHNFRGHSMWNPLHGLLKSGKFGRDADLLICGDKHNWGFFKYENPDRGVVQTLVRVRGYKFLDDYARQLGIEEQQRGCSVLTVFNPENRKLSVFEDVVEGASYLTWLRKGKR